MKTKSVILIQTVFLAIALMAVYLLYPKINASVAGNTIRFETGNVNILVLSDNPEFNDSRYIAVYNNLTINLSPGTYYWRAGNGVIWGVSHRLDVNSEVGLRLNENDSELENIGNVKVNVSRTSDGSLVGQIILEPEQAEKIENGTYVGRQA